MGGVSVSAERARLKSRRRPGLFSKVANELRLLLARRRTYVGAGGAARQNQKPGNNQLDRECSARAHSILYEIGGLNGVPIYGQ